MFNLKFALIAVAVLAIGGFLYHDKLGWDLAKKHKAEAAVLTATLETERANRKTEQDDRKRNDETVTELQSELTELRKPHPIPRVRCYASMPSAAPEGNAATGTDGSPAGDSPEGPLRDIGAALDAARIEQQTNATIQLKLAEWEVARTH